MRPELGCRPVRTTDYASGLRSVGGLRKWPLSAEYDEKIETPICGTDSGLNDRLAVLPEAPPTNTTFPLLLNRCFQILNGNRSPATPNSRRFRISCSFSKSTACVANFFRSASSGGSRSVTAP
jgi:hypothetical protein